MARIFDPFYRKRPRAGEKGQAQRFLGKLDGAGIMGIKRNLRNGDRIKVVDFGAGIKTARIRRAPAVVEVETPKAAATLDVVNLLAYTKEGTYWGSTDGLVWVDLTASSGAEIAASDHKCMIKHGDTIFWFESVSGSSKYQTTTDGKTWSAPLSIGFSGGTVSAAHSNGFTILVGFEDGAGEPVVWRSTDDGDTWSASAAIPNKEFRDKPTAFIKYPGRHGMITEDGTVFMSVNDGASWTGQSSLFPAQTGADRFLKDFVYSPGHFFGTDVFFVVGVDDSFGLFRSCYWETTSQSLFGWFRRGPFNDTSGLLSADLHNATGSVWMVGNEHDIDGKAELRRVPPDTVSSGDRQDVFATWTITQANVVYNAILSGLIFAGGGPGQTMQFNSNDPDTDTWESVTDWAYGGETVVGIIERAAVS